MRQALSPHLQRLSRFNDWTMVGVFAGTGALFFVSDYGPVVERLIALPCLITAPWSSYYWSRPVSQRITAGLLALSAVTAAVGSLLGIGPLATFGLNVTGAIAVARLRRHRWAWALVLLVVATGLAALSWIPADGSRWPALTCAMTAGSCAGYLVCFVLGHKGWRLTIEADAGRRAERDLAVARERFRFAADLHDIQGHTLHVVKLKAALAERLVRRDPERAEDELRQIRDLIADTIAQTREIANAERRLTLAGELTNAENLLRAAGAEVSVTRLATPPPTYEEPFSLVLREATTNILRHAQATNVRIEIAADSLVIDNDGARRGPRPHLGGLAVLRERLATAGGQLTAEQHDGAFRTAVRFESMDDLLTGAMSGTAGRTRIQSSGEAT